MATKFNNRTLIIILVFLTGAFFISRAIMKKRYAGTLKTDLIQIDSSLVNSILLYPAIEKGEEILFTHSGNSWTVNKGEKTATADKNSVKNMFSELLSLSPERLVTRNKNQWSAYGVNDSLGTRVIMKQGKKKVLDLMVGRFDYQPGPSGYQGYGGRYGSGLTYIRLYDEYEVYAVKGFLSMSFNQAFNNWRNQIVTNINKNNINKLSFDYPSDSGFIALKSDTIWIIDGIQADSTAMAQYLNTLSRRSNLSFVDDFSPVIAPDYELTIEGDEMNPITIKAYNRSDNELILNSSMNPESYFTSTRTGLFQTIFKPKSQFFKHNTK